MSPARASQSRAIRKSPAKSGVSRSSKTQSRPTAKPKKNIWQRLKTWIHHYVLPNEKNSHRAKLLHTDTLLLLIGGIGLLHVVCAMIFRYPVLPDVLGAESPITQHQILEYINQERQSHGLPTLELHPGLNQAAESKANDMLRSNYWSHTSPSGREPWDFVEATGYAYSVAGENLARNFSSAQGMTAAWMASPSHRANILHTQYQETGIAVVQGQMNGRNTTLVVQMFAAPEGAIAQALPEQPQPTQLIANTLEPTQNILGVQDTFSPLNFYRGGVMVILAVLGFVTVMDMTHAQRKKIQRPNSRGWAHLTLIIAVMATVALAERGSLL